MNKSETGKFGEDAVCAYLERKGYLVIKRNYRIRGGEIDIIAQKDGYIAFVEVKTRSSDSISNGFDAIDSNKIKAVIRTAENYLNKYPSDLQPRFDAAQVIVENDKIPYIEYIINAFESI